MSACHLAFPGHAVRDTLLFIFVPVVSVEFRIVRFFEFATIESKIRNLWRFVWIDTHLDNCTSRNFPWITLATRFSGVSHENPVVTAPVVALVVTGFCWWTEDLFSL